MNKLANTYCPFCDRPMGRYAPQAPGYCYGDCDGAVAFFDNITTASHKDYIEGMDRGNQNQRACLMILRGAIDAPHHRQWYLDQALRLLSGSAYTRMISAFEVTAGIGWDKGIAP